MELLDIVDENNNLTGEAKDREIVHSEGLFHREVGVIILNEEGKILLEKRAPTKKQSPNKWALCAGHIEAGDTHENAIVREIKEEIGVELTLSDLEFLGLFRRAKCFSNGQKNNVFIYIYLLKTNNKIEDYIIQEEELSEVKYFSISEVEDAVLNKNEDFAFYDEPYIIEVLKVVKEM